MKKLSIIIPAFNEASFITKVLNQVLSIPTESVGYIKEVIVVDDGSIDDTFELASNFSGIKVFQQSNQGKGSAVQFGVAQATGDLILVQDADLEYEPTDYLPMLKATDGMDDVAVYGSRIKGVIRDHGWKWPFPGRHPSQGLGPWLANILISTVTMFFYGRFITDMLTAYKLYPAKVVQDMKIRTCGFEADHELTAKLIKLGIKINEVPISYTPRSVSEGKKIRARDGLIAIWTLLRFRIVD